MTGERQRLCCEMTLNFPPISRPAARYGLKTSCTSSLHPAGDGMWFNKLMRRRCHIKVASQKIGVASASHACNLRISDALFSMLNWWKSIHIPPFGSIGLSFSNKKDIVTNMKWITAHLSYLRDAVLEKHPSSYLLILATICIILVAVGGFAFHILRSDQQELGDSLWDAWACLCSSGTHLRERNVSGRMIGILLAIGGLLFYSLLTSTLTAQFKSRMEILREGANSKVMEAGHTVICGANSHLATILKQLNKSRELAFKNGNSSSRKQTVVLVSDNLNDGSLLNTTKECHALNIIHRRGSLSNSDTFQMAGAARACRVIFLARKTDAYEADADVLLSVLTLQPLREQRPMELVVEVSKDGTAQLLKSLISQNLTAVQDLSSKLLVQCSRQRGLVDVYRELLDHGGQCIHLQNYPYLAGFQYGDVRRGCHEGVVCGLIRNALIDFHPTDDSIIQCTDELIIISEKKRYQELSKSFLLPMSRPLFNSDSVIPRSSKPLSKIEWSIPSKESIVILGWRNSVKEMIVEYNDYVGTGSQLMILAEEPLEKRQLPLSVTDTLKNIKVIQKVGNPLNETDLKSAILDVQKRKACRRGNERAALSIVVIVDETGILESDKQSIYALLLAASICQQLKVKVGSLVAELIDTNLGKQVMIVKSHEYLTFIGTSELIGLVTAQAAENAELNGIWTELLNSWGNEIYVKDKSLYMKDGETPSFEELSDRGVVRDEVVIGYRISNEIVINPIPKNIPIAFNSGDSLIVISEFEYGNCRGKRRK